MWILFLGIFLVLLAIGLGLLWFVFVLSPLGRIWQMRSVLNKVRKIPTGSATIQDVLGDFLQTSTGQSVQEGLGIHVEDLGVQLPEKKKLTGISLIFWILLGCLLIGGIVLIVSYFMMF